MIKITDKTYCSGCAACYSVCPIKCVTMKEDEEGFLYPEVNETKCINCHLCEKTCPIINKPQVTSNVGPLCYASYAKDEEIRMQSSSGGMFSVFANYILSQGGVVFGAAYDNDYSVHHIYIDKKEDLYKLRTSKYVQSRVEDTYKEAKSFLDEGRLVLYTGTPCEINGLYNYLGKEYENLYLVDIICHRIGSPLVWRKYLDSLGYEDSRDSISSINFRDKVSGWSTSSLTIQSKNKKQALDKTQDPYLKVYWKDLCLRPSCFDCQFRGKHRINDVTIADFWGIQDMAPSMYDEQKGTSLMVLHSPKGIELFNAIKEKIVYLETDLDLAIRKNQPMIVSDEKPLERDAFMKEISENKIPFLELSAKYTK